MGSSAKRRQTMAKMERERSVREKRQRKLEKQEAKKMAAALEREGPPPTWIPGKWTSEGAERSPRTPTPAAEIA